MKVAVPKEAYAGERRVALVPATLASLAKRGAEVLIERGAGTRAGFPDSEYEQKGATLVSDRDELFSQADVVLTVRSPGSSSGPEAPDLARLKRGQIVVGLSDPLSSTENLQRLASLGVTHFALELIPRITRAQSMDVLSSMATIAGYKAVLLAAVHCSKMFPMLMTAAGTVTPAHAFVIGAGVAGLQAIATARRLGAIVQAYDVRPAVKEQVQSVGAKFVEMELEASSAEDKGGYAKELGEDFYRRQRELMARVVGESTAVITTAAIPGKKAPVLVTEEMVRGMQPGSVIVDLAAERGGNCELTRVDEVVEAHGVTILGPGNIPATVPNHSSQMYSKNIATFLLHLIKEGSVQIDLEDEITRETLVTRGGEIVQARVRELAGLAPLSGPSSGTSAEEQGAS